MTTMTVLLAACGPKAPQQVHVVHPPPPAQIVIPKAQPVPSPVARSISDNPKNDPLGLVIVEAKVRFEHGQDLYKKGFLQKAKEEFDGALDLLLDSSSLYPNNPRLDQAINTMVTQVHALELEAFKNGDGFTDQT